MADGVTESTKTLPTRERPLELHGRVAIVTGAAKGMGAPICAALAEEGAAVVLAGRDMDAIEAHDAELRARFPDLETLTVRCDVTDEAATAELAAATLERFGRINILVNTAGVIGPIETPAQHVPLEDFRFVLDVNIVGTFLPCKAVIPAMIDAGHGRIVNLAGTSGLRGYRNRVAYSSSKWAVRGLTRTLALELGPHDVTVNTVCPNVTNGDRMDRIVTGKAERTGRSYGEVYADFASQTALGRFIDEVDVAEAVRFLVSDRARNMTGHDIVVDAGWDV
ncbi:MAG: short chain dehydrogenase family protein [Solirubrobacterales bacterium]|jgi:3-oxoacyl-[acyl-carrier protein] reductase|nr:short chain dehydrogenase family protein [Solirubrobacterales bacterium]